MSVIENLAFQQEEPPPSLQPIARIDDAEAVFNSLSIESENNVRILGDQLVATRACAKRIAHEWFAFADRSAMNGFEYLRRVARAETPVEAAELQKDLAKAQIAAMHDCWNECARLAALGIAECACEK